MSERIDRLMNIHIEDYAQNEKEQPVYAMLRLYLNCAEKPEEVIDKAQCGGEELVTVLMKAAKNMIYETSEFRGRFGPMKIF